MHGVGLADHALADLVLHFQQFIALAFEHAVDRNAGPARHHRRHVIGGHRFGRDDGRRRRAFGRLQLFLELGHGAVLQLARLLIIAAANGVGEIVLGLVELFLQLGRRIELVLLGLPLRGQRVGLLFELRQIFLKPLQPVLGRGVALLLQRLLLDLEPHDLAVEIVELFGFGIDLHAQPRRRLVDQVDGLVGQEAVGDVAVRQGRRRHQRAVGDLHLVVRLVSVLQAAQDRDRILDARLVDIDRLEAPRQGGVLLDVLAVFVERGGADAMQVAARQRRFEQVRRIHGAVGLAGADDGVHLIDEENVEAGSTGDFLPSPP